MNFFLVKRVGCSMSLLNNLNFDKIEENQTGTVKRQTNIPVSFLGQVQIYFFTDKRSDRFKN